MIFDRGVSLVPYDRYNQYDLYDTEIDAQFTQRKERPSHNVQKINRRTDALHTSYLDTPICLLSVHIVRYRHPYIPARNLESMSGFRIFLRFAKATHDST